MRQPWYRLSPFLCALSALVLGLLGACSADLETAPPSTPPRDRFDLDGDGFSPPQDCLEEGFAWRTDSTSCNELQRVFFEAPDGKGAKDFSAIDVDGELHLFYIENPGPIGPDGHETTFGHVSSRDLVHWERFPSVAPPDEAGSFHSTAIWAPHVIQVGRRWYMFYTGVRVDGPRSANRQRIGVLESTDLLNWTPVDRHCAGVSGAGCVLTCEAAFTAWGTDLPWGSDCRDAFVLPVGDAWMMLVTVRQPDGQQAIATARSQNLLDWELVGVIESTRDRIAESPSALLDTSGSRPVYRLFWTNSLGIHHLQQTDAFSPNWSRRAFVQPGFASELLLAGRNTHFFLYVDSELRIQFERIVLGDDWLHFTRVVAPRCRIPASQIHPMDFDPIDGIDNNCDGRVDLVVPPTQDPIVLPSTRGLTMEMPRSRFH